jgi:hypothetical protein
MSDQDTGDTMETATPAAAPTAEETTATLSANPSGGDTPSDEGSGDSEHMIPKHRFDEVNNKMKDLERRMEETSSKNQSTEKTIDALRTALDGGSGTQVDEAVKEIMGKHNLKGNDLTLVEDILAAAERKVSSKLEAQMKPLKAQQVVANYEKDLRALSDQYPEVSGLSKEEKAEFQKMAFSKEWGNAPLEGVWKSYAYDKPRGNSKTLEASSQGRARSMSGEKSIEDMSLEEFEDYSNKLGG